MLLVLNLPLIRLWVKLLQVPYPLLAPLIVALLMLLSPLVRWLLARKLREMVGPVVGSAR